MANTLEPVSIDKEIAKEVIKGLRSAIVEIKRKAERRKDTTVLPNHVVTYVLMELEDAIAAFGE